MQDAITCILVDEDEVIAVGKMNSFHWSGRVEDLPTFNQLVDIKTRDESHNCLVPFSGSVNPSRQGQGITTFLVALPPKNHFNLRGQDF